MRRVCVIIMLFTPFSAWSQVSESGASANLDRLHYYFNLYAQADGRLAPNTGNLDEFVNDLTEKRRSAKNDRAFIYQVFIRTHKKYFHRFEEYATFRDLVSNGIYNCLTGTSLISIVLQYFNIDYEIIETNYHVFLMVDHGKVLLETTNINGFVDNPAEIKRLVVKYQQLTVDKKVTSKKYYEFEPAPMDSVSTEGMLGLLHYNSAIATYNQQQFSPCITHLQHALLLHRSSKVDAFLDLVTETVANSSTISENDRALYLQKLRTLKQRRTVHTSLTFGKIN